MKIESNRIWASHRPLVLAVIDVYRPSFVLELGIGDFSTPLFQNKEFDYLGVESDPEWIERIAGKYPYAEIIPHIDQFTAEYGISGLELIPDSGNTR